MIKAAVFGYGNVGKCVVETCLDSKDFELVTIVDNAYANEKIHGIKVINDMSLLPEVDVAILSLPSRLVPDIASELLKKGVSTADSYDIHTNILEVRNRLDKIAKETGTVSVTAAGWDPGTDSVIRTLMEAMAPKGLSYTNFGPGMSMGHSVAAKAVKGVKNAISMTIPSGCGIHRRMVYIELMDGFNLSTVAAAIKADDYFAHDETHVIAVENVSSVLDVGHGVHIERKGVSGITHNQLFEFNMKINNPALTAQILVSAARAATRQKPGCYTMIEIPPIDFLSENRETAIKRLV